MAARMPGLSSPPRAAMPGSGKPCKHWETGVQRDEAFICRGRDAPIGHRRPRKGGAISVFTHGHPPLRGFSLHPRRRGRWRNFGMRKRSNREGGNDMALSKAERDADLWLYENAPYINGLSQAQFDRLPQDEKDRHVQIIMQVPATVLGYWKTCDVSVCRRARRCRGFLTKALRETGNYKIPYPPAWVRAAAIRQRCWRCWNSAIISSMQRCAAPGSTQETCVNAY